MSERLPINLIQLTPVRFELQWPPLISEEVLHAKLQVKAYLEKTYGDIISELRVGFATLSVNLHDGVVITNWQELLEELNSLQVEATALPKRTWTIPVCYGGKFGKDLQSMSRLINMDEDSLIQLHQSGEYLLHFYGFLPGFMYLGGLPSQLHCARKSVPDREIPAGTVAIGGQQTGIYPIASPGGWHAIGRSPLAFADFQQKRPQVGDRIRFSAIDAISYESISEAVQKGIYQWPHD